MGVSTTDAMVLDGHPQVHPLVSSMTYTEKAAPATHFHTHTILTEGHQGEIPAGIISVNSR